jgi:hypothetical protein
VIKIKPIVKEFWRRNSIAILHTPVLVVMLVCAYIVLKAIDPRIGVEGFGDLFGYLKNSVGLAVVIFTSWWFKNNAWHDVTKASEEDLFHEVRQNVPGAFKAKVLDRLEWAFLLCFNSYWVFS